MSNKYIIADLHLGDSSVAKYRGVTVEENFEKVLEAFSKFTKNDTVIILGDLGSSFGYIERFIEEVKCKLFIVAGNHDNVELIRMILEKGIPVVSSITKCNYLLTHIPVHPSELINFSGNIHGHLHSGAKIKGNYFNVCIDVIGYNPIPFNRKFSGISKKTSKYINKPKQKRKYG